MKVRYTKHQLASGARADVETQDSLYLLKNVSALRLTYQIRLLTFRASEARKTLVVQVPKHCKIHAHLREFVKQFRQNVRIKKV